MGSGMIILLKKFDLAAHSKPSAQKRLTPQIQKTNQTVVFAMVAFSGGHVANVGCRATVSHNRATVSSVYKNGFRLQFSASG
jgi:hypothetical protein